MEIPIFPPFLLARGISEIPSLCTPLAILQGTPADCEVGGEGRPCVLACVCSGVIHWIPSDPMPIQLRRRFPHWEEKTPQNTGHRRNPVHPSAAQPSSNGISFHLVPFRLSQELDCFPFTSTEKFRHITSYSFPPFVYPSTSPKALIQDLQRPQILAEAHFLRRDVLRPTVLL